VTLITVALPEPL